MSNQATLNRAARLLALISPREPADAVLRRELAARRDLPPAERRAIVQAITACFRWRCWLEERESPQRQLEAALAWQVRFEANPAAIKPEALAARAVPEWLRAEMETIPDEWLRQLQRDPPLWIRVRQKFVESLPRMLGHCMPAAISEPATAAPTAFRYTGTQDLFLTKPFQQGQFEIQDLASQLVGHACAPQPGETWWDACAGEGGKTLHLADLMHNQGLIWASDRSARRLQTLKKRAARAEVFNYRTAFWNGGAHPPTKTRFDGILVDAPCSGVGTWQRNPQARWTTSPEDVRELARVQRQLLDHAAGALKPGGRLIYSVCTLTRTETTAVADAFTQAHPELAPDPVFQQPPDSAFRSPACLVLWPQALHANGMFIAAWKRK